MKKFQIISTIIIITLSSCCSECKECQLNLKYEWKISNQGCAINIQNDNLILSEIFYKKNPNGLEDIAYTKNSGHYVIDKKTGSIIDSIFDNIPKSLENLKNFELSVVGQIEIRTFVFETTTFQYTIVKKYNGYKIVLQEWYKNIRGSNNRLNSVIVFNENNKIKEFCLPVFSDFTFDEKSFYINSEGVIYKFNYAELIK